MWQEIHSEIHVSCLRGVATPDPWNTSSCNYYMAEFQGQVNGLEPAWVMPGLHPSRVAKSLQHNSPNLIRSLLRGVGRGPEILL